MSIRKENLKRLLAPKNIAFIGGKDAAFSARQCAEHFPGPVWGVNPKREYLGGQPCYPTVFDLPESPDAVFLATPRVFTTEIVAQLNTIGAGGVVCFTAGYGELGENGRDSEQKLIEAAGDLALVGPNCYGLVSYVNNAVLWPFGAGQPRCEKGIALIMQSGMIAANLIMNQRSVPFAYVISAGNQSILAIEDYIDVFADDPAVSAIGLYVEGIVNMEAFANASMKALRANKPIVVLKGGSSAIGSQLTVSHTGSLSGTDDAYDSLFRQLGILRVDSPEAMLETLKFITISGLPNGNRLFAFTCSGGDAALVADYCEKRDLNLIQPQGDQKHNLSELLPDIATVSNPLDYTTPLWGNTDVLPNVFRAAMTNSCDMAIFIQDYPPTEIHPDNSAYVSDGLSFMKVVNELEIPSGICSDISENIDSDSRQRMIDRGITPMQGIDRGLNALADALWLNDKRQELLSNLHDHSVFRLIKPKIEPSADGELITLDEWESKHLLKDFGIAVPRSLLLDTTEITGQIVKHHLKFPLAVKAVSSELTHKTDVGAVWLNVGSDCEIIDAIEKMKQSFLEKELDLTKSVFLVEEMITETTAELLIGVRLDQQFGLVMVIASGGILVELISDGQTLLLPTTKTRIQSALESLSSYRLLLGYRGKAGANIPLIVDTILKIASFAESRADNLFEMDINPLIVGADSAYAADALIRLHQ
ncbi:MAG: CoA-binding protein [Gammaproteobacteria bacterium]|nr:CoA-binding protein [Gammaproteobacteria bacterium]